MTTEKASESTPQAKAITGKEHQGQKTRRECRNGFVHILTIDVYCCPLEEVVVKDEQTEEKC